MDLAGLIVTIVVSTLAASGLVLLLYFTAFGHIRLKKKVSELDRRFEYLHALLFGQDSQRVKHLEMISQTNLLYVDVHMKFNKIFKDIRDKDDATAQATINSLKDMLADKKYHDLKAALPNASTVISNFEDSVNNLDKQLTEIVRPEEECRQDAVTLKDDLRKIKQDYYVKQADLTLVSASFDAVFSKLESMFDQFESYIESAQYDDAKALLKQASDVINQLGAVLKLLPNICVTIQSVIPDKLASLENRYEEMTAAQYPLFHLIVKGNIQDMRTELDAITKRIQLFDIKGISDELNAIVARIEDYFTDFDREKDARVVFERECDDTYREENSIENNFIKLCNALPHVRKIYIIDSGEQAKIDAIQNSINKAGATKRSLDTFIHSATKQPYSLLVDKMHALRGEADQATTSIDDFQRYLTSLKSDAEAANNALREYFDKLKNDEQMIRDMSIESISNRYGPQIDDLYATLDDLAKTLSTLPIDVIKANADLTKLKTTGSEVSHNIAQDHEKMLLAEASITYANRERYHLNDVNTLVLQTEGLFYSGDFIDAYDQTVKMLQGLRRNGSEQKK